jgi:2C-methyl-D-erythritol 2,4-cyclodiphosphate synthase
MPEDVGIVVSGRQMVIPGVVAVTRTDGFNQPRPPLLKRAAVIATSLGGPPREFVRLTPENYARILKGGKGLKALDFAVNPSPDVPGLGECDYYRINNATRATLDLGDLLLTLLPTHAGIAGNGVRARRDSVSGGAAVLKLEDAAADLFEESPPLGPALEVEYLGGGVSPSVEVTTTNGQKTLILTGENASENYALALGEGGIRTFADLAAFLNGTSAWAGTVLHSHHTFDPSLLPDGTVTVTSNKAVLDLGAAAQVAWLEGSEIARGEPVASAATGTDEGWLYFSGGSEGDPVVLADYEAAFQALQSRDVQAVYVESTDPAVHAMAEQHCTLMSHPVEQNERRVYCGPALEANKAAQQTAAEALARELQSELATVVGTPLRRRNLRTGRIEDLSPNETAAMILGMACGVRPEIDLTYKTLRVAGTVFEYDRQEIGAFIKAGALAVFYDDEDGVFRIADDVTSWQRDSNIMHRLRFGVDLRHYLVRKIRRYTKPFVGGVGDASTVESILNATERALREEVRGGQNPEGVLSGVGAILAVFDGVELVAIDFEANAVGRIGFIRHTALLVPTTIQLAA